MSRFLALAALFAAAVVILPAQEQRTAPALARALQDRYKQINDFKADFSQTTKGGALRTETRGEGTVAVKKPGRMRWEYEKPEKQTIVSNGDTIITYFPEDRQALRSDVPKGDGAPTSMLFLAGKGDVARDFTPSLTPSPVPGTTGLKLTPRQSEPEYEFLVVALDPGTLQIRGLMTRDQLGSETTIVFRNLKENTRIPDKTFEFTPPKGVRVEPWK